MMDFVTELVILGLHQLHFGGRLSVSGESAFDSMSTGDNRGIAKCEMEDLRTMLKADVALQRDYAL